MSLFCVNNNLKMSALKFTSPGVVTRPDFNRGTIGRDINPAQFHTVQGNVIDKTQRDVITNNSKSAHFRVGGSGKF
jgi:hypothetical protein